MSTPPYSACKLPRKRAKRSLRVYAFILISLPLFTLKANAIDIDKALPALSISDGGEITLDNGKAKFIAWSSDTLADKVTLLQVLAASQEAADINKSYLDQFSARFEGNAEVASATIIVSNNIPKLFGGFVKKELKKNKKAHPAAIMVNDKKGVSRDTWLLPDTLSVMMLIDNDGMVRKYHEGKLPGDQEQHWLAKIDQLLANESKHD